MDGLLFTARDEGLTKEADMQHDGGITTGVTGSPVTSEDFTDDSDDNGDVEAVRDKSTGAMGLSSLDITVWRHKVTNSEPAPPSLIPSAFERGAIGRMSVNDVLMVEGLISPSIYIHFFDLSYFSC
jgi:hypothetical protein